MRELITRRPSRAHTPPAARQSGVTLIELVVVMILIAILLAIGIPSYYSVTTSNRLATEMDALVGDLQYARSEAVREGQSVSVCAQSSTTPDTCAAAGSDAWQSGWIVFTDFNADGAIDSGNDTILRLQPALKAGDVFTASSTAGTGTPTLNYVLFNRDGFAYVGAASMTLTLTDPSGESYFTRCLMLSQSGVVSTETGTSCP